jgi:S1-C subfamily serine protease
MKSDQRSVGVVIVLSLLLGSGAGIISSTITSRAIESYAAQLLNDQKLISLIPRKSPSLPGTFEEAMKKNREASLRSLAVILPAAQPSALASGWVFPEGALKLGVPVTNDGWILTTSSAFSTKAALKDWEVYAEGKRFLIEKVVRDPHSTLVLLKLQNANGLSTVSFGKPEDVESGSTVIGWGGEEDIRATLLEAADADVKQGPQSAETFSTTWRVGMSLPAGVPVFSSDAELLGFVTSGTDVFPLHHSGEFVQDVLKTGSPKLAKLGVTILDLSRAYNVSEVVTQSRGEGALLLTGAGELHALDIILDVDGRAVTHADTLAEILADYEPGEIANMHVLRDGQNMQFAVTLSEL